MPDRSANSVEQTIENKLKAQFNPLALQIINESGKHQGHSGHKGGVAEETGETHFRVEIVSEKFAGQSLQARHRAVYHCLAEELAASVHALALTAKTPEENFEDK